MDFSRNGRRNDHDAIQWRISSYLDSFFVLYGLGSKQQKSQNLLIQFWAATNHTSEEGTKFCVLTTKDQPCDLIFSDQGFSSYRNYSVACSITVPDYEKQQNHKMPSVPGRVYRNKMPEMTPDISYYSVDDYSHRDFALSCGIRTSICLPVFEYNYGCRNGVLELVSTSDDLELLMSHVYSSYSYAGLKMITQVKHPFRLNLQDIDIPLCASKEINHVLGVVCQEFGVPLAQCWVIGNHDLCISDHLKSTTEALVVTNCASSMHYESITSWCEFKRACWQMCMRKEQGVVGKTFLSQKPCFCRDITQFSMTKYPLVHFARKCGTVACFTICLHSFVTENRDYVLEFFLPHEKIDSSLPLTLLNALLATLKEHFQTFVVVSERLGEELNVVVVDSSMHKEPGPFKIGKSFENEGRVATIVHCNRQSAVEDDPRQDMKVLDVEKDTSSTHFYGESGSKEISRSRFDNAAEIINSDESGEGLPIEFIECDEPQLFSSQAKRSLLQKQIFPLKECIESEREGLEPDPSHKQMFVQDTTNQKGVGTKKDGRRIYEKHISFESLSEHFGRRLDDAAKSFNVSRSTFKRMCRENGITRWKSKKRQVESRTFRREKNCGWRMPRMVDTASPHTRQNMDEVTVKAVYRGVILRFELPLSSGMRELEENLIERLHLEREEFCIKYKDDEGDWVLIACEKDMQKCLEITKYLEKTTIKMLVEPPIHHHGP